VSVLHAVLHDRPPAPCAVAAHVPAALSELVMRLLAKDPADRPGSAREVAEALWAIDPADARPAPMTAPRERRSPRQPRWSWAFKLTLSLTISLGLLLAVGLPWLRDRSGLPDSPAPDVRDSEMTAEAARPRLKGIIDIRIWRTGPDGAAARLRLSDPGALPLKPGDQFRIAARADRPAYLYLFWIDTEGHAVPVYPWQPGQWGTRPADERPVAALELPPTAAKGYTISGDRPGMETLILVARPERLTLTDEQIRGWFAGLPAQRPFQNPESAVWFENGRIVTGDDSRRPRGFEETAIADPVLRVQGLLKERIGPHAAGTAAVSFARLGRGGMP
jgi:hypothetical protein